MNNPSLNISPSPTMSPSPRRPPRQIDSKDAARILKVKHWNDHLFSFQVERPPALRFRSGEFVMLGLLGENDKPILRAYSIASPSWDDVLEFYSIKVQDGALTSKLQHLQAGDDIILKTKPVGTLVLDALLPFDDAARNHPKNLYLMATGTGFAPFASLIRDLEVYERFDRVIVTHTCRNLSDFSYSKTRVDETLTHEYIGDMARDKLLYYPSSTRQQAPVMGRITHLIETGQMAKDLNLPPLNPAHDRVMICGSMAFNLSMVKLLGDHGFAEGSNSQPGGFVIEKAFVG